MRRGCFSKCRAETCSLYFFFDLSLTVWPQLVECRQCTTSPFSTGTSFLLSCCLSRFFWFADFLSCFVSVFLYFFLILFFFASIFLTARASVCMAISTHLTHLCVRGYPPWDWAPPTPDFNPCIRVTAVRRITTGP